TWRPLSFRAKGILTFSILPINVAVDLVPLSRLLFFDDPINVSRATKFGDHRVPASLLHCWPGTLEMWCVVAASSLFTSILLMLCGGKGKSKSKSLSYRPPFAEQSAGRKSKTIEAKDSSLSAADKVRAGDYWAAHVNPGHFLNLFGTSYRFD
uniref:MLO-like protein n=1 Tax=Bursaphelenchus xylophilus TaxID=6326 RepID=A0A1I7SP51_BURXY